MHPIVLGPNRPSRFYLGGGRIDRFRGVPNDGPDRPEDWVASTTTLFGQPQDGLTTIEGRTLRDLIEEQPDPWLGADQVARLGAETGLLVKLLAPAQRLPIHAHPDRAFAERWLSSAWGKTEAWIVLDAGPDGAVWLGWLEAMTLDSLQTAVEAQDADALLAKMHRLPVSKGDAILVPAGTPHAIGPDMLILELQEPTDYSILLEWSGFDIDGPRDGHLGLGFGVALAAVGMQATTPQQLESLVRRPGGSVDGTTGLLPSAADPFFRAETVHGDDADRPAGFCVLIVTSGEGWLDRRAGDPTAVRAGMTLVVPAAAGRWRLRGEVAAIECRPGSDG